MSEVYMVKAVPWAQGWELHVPGVGVTQVRVLANAEQQVRDLIGTMLDCEADDAVIVVGYELHGLEKEIIDVQRQMRAALDMQATAAESMRRIVAALRDDGVSVSDIATVLGVSRGRVSQLVA